MQAQDHQVAEAHPEHPHGEDADRHCEGGVAGGAEDVGQGEAGRQMNSEMILNQTITCSAMALDSGERLNQDRVMRFRKKQADRFMIQAPA